MTQRALRRERPCVALALARTSGSLVAGAVVVALGVVLLLDATGSLDLRFAALAPVACGAVGAILLAFEPA